MAIQIYNTLTRQKEDFKTQQVGQVSFYLCGPTVYNYIHIGNARSAVAFDTVRRYLEYRGFQVNYVSNFTDVDDKIIKAAIEEGKSTQEISDKYIEAFFQDTQALNIKTASHHPLVKDNIPEIIDFVQKLVDSDHAYVVEGDVYFRTRSFPDYGKLSHQSLEDLWVGASARTESSETERKEDPLDFALWKAAKSDEEMSWESPWGLGRPGWHIECSVMSTKYLGATLDIHAGGQDLEFPHHENEIAQSEACTGQVFAKYWMHNGFVTIGQDDEKMSKSLGNFVLLRDLLAGVDPMVVRYLLASVHYRKPLRYDSVALAEAEGNVRRLRDLLRRLDLALADLVNLDDPAPALRDYPDLAALETQFTQAMDDDFNAANGLSQLFELVKVINQSLAERSPDTDRLLLMWHQINQWLWVFGLDLKPEVDELDAEIEKLIQERQEARKQGDYGKADAIRDQLKDQGILLDDTATGTQWKRVN